MRRRQFLQGTLMSGIFLPSFLFHACQSPSSSDSPSQNPGPSTGDDFPLNELSIRDLQKKMQSGEYTSRALVELYLKRIEAIDDNGVALAAVIELNPDAMRIAEALDAERRSGTVRGLLHGIPFLIDLVNGDSFSGYGMGSGAAMAGYPSITVPMGEVHGLPVGLLFLAGAYQEDKLLTIAYAYEQASLKRSAPAFRNSIS